jgi:hypothetical protein
MTKFKCLKTLKMRQTKQVCFAEGKVYDCTKEFDEGVGYELIDELGDRHSISDEWIDNFKKLEE